MNRPAVEKLLAHLKEQRDSESAARFNMRFFGYPCNENYGLVEGQLAHPVCKTQACLAGEALLANGLAKIPKTGGIQVNEEVFGHDIETVAVRALGLSEEEQHHLFYFTRWIDDTGFHGWPFRFEAAYDEARTPSARLQVAIDRVQHFLDTDGAE